MKKYQLLIANQITINFQWDEDSTPEYEEDFLTDNEISLIEESVFVYKKLSGDAERYEEGEPCSMFRWEIDKASLTTDSFKHFSGQVISYDYLSLEGEKIKVDIDAKMDIASSLRYGHESGQISFIKNQIPFNWEVI